MPAVQATQAVHPHFEDAEAVLPPVPAKAPSRYVIPRALAPHYLNAAAIGQSIGNKEAAGDLAVKSLPTIDNTHDKDAIIEQLTRSVASLKSSLEASEEQTDEIRNYSEEMKTTLETALEAANNEIANVKNFYDDEITKLSRQLEVAQISAETASDEASDLKRFFASSKAYNVWKKSGLQEAFKSLPAQLSGCAELIKTFSDGDLAITAQVRCIIHNL